ncbi:MAG: MoxR family ATPase [Verrucomicrobia bacterium]|jgi:MoxR-like ATPase|nr:MoxR family ATPase [Verrucomicrobiota bacterium]
MPKSPCHICNQPLEYPEELAGQQVECPHCGTQTKLPVMSDILVRIPSAVDESIRQSTESPIASVAQKVLSNMGKVVVGKEETMALALTACLADGHVLFEDVPGVAKTMLARAMAISMGCPFKRIQCTPDLLPSDISGSSVFNPKTTDFEFRAGPLFTQVLLADEINRATPRAQSALLEAMAERKVTVDGKTHALEAPFFLIATQNPIDHEGTFPLPEAQLDRFLMRLQLGYPGTDLEIQMLQNNQLQHPIETLEAVTDSSEVLECQTAVRNIKVHPKVAGYIVDIVEASRGHDDIQLGASPRASLALFRCAQAYAGIHGYDFVTPDDVKYLAPFIMMHRLLLKPETRLRKRSSKDIMRDILNSISVPQIRTEDLNA